MILQVRRYTAGTPDAHGNTSHTFADPHDWHVHGLAPGSLEEPGATNRDLSVVEWSVLAPKSDDAPTERDVVIVDGDEFTVEGRPADWTRGPWQHPTAGLVVELRRAEG